MTYLVSFGARSSCMAKNKETKRQWDNEIMRKKDDKSIKRKRREIKEKQNSGITLCIGVEYVQCLLRLEMVDKMKRGRKKECSV